MSQDNKHISIADSIVQKIQNGTLKQKPKWRFFLHNSLLVLLTTVLVLLTLYVVNFIILVGREQELGRILGLGPRFTLEFVEVLPWILILLLTAVFAILQMLIRYFNFGYQKPVLYTFLGTIFLTAAVSYGYTQLDPENKVVRFGESGGVPLLSEAHNVFRDGRQGAVARGVLTSVEGDTYTLETYRSSSTIVFMTSPRLGTTTVEFEPGDSVLVVLHKRDGELEALAVQKIKERGTMPPPRANRDPEMRALHKDKDRNFDK